MRASWIFVLPGVTLVFCSSAVLGSSITVASSQNVQQASDGAQSNSGRMLRSHAKADEVTDVDGEERMIGNLTKLIKGSKSTVKYSEPSDSLREMFEKVKMEKGDFSAPRPREIPREEMEDAIRSWVHDFVEANKKNDVPPHTMALKFKELGMNPDLLLTFLLEENKKFADPVKMEIFIIYLGIWRPTVKEQP